MNCKSCNMIMILNVLMMIKYMMKILMYNIYMYVENNVKNLDNMFLKRKKIDQIEKLFREIRVGF